MNTFQELFFRVKLEQLITEREGMLALNQCRERRGETQAYGEEHFIGLQEQFVKLEEQIVDLSELPDLKKENECKQ